MSKSITWDDEVFTEFMSQKQTEAALLHLDTLTINQFMRRLLTQHALDQAVREAEG